MYLQGNHSPGRVARLINSTGELPTSKGIIADLFTRLQTQDPAQVAADKTSHKLAADVKTRSHTRSDHWQNHSWSILNVSVGMLDDHVLDLMNSKA